MRRPLLLLPLALLLLLPAPPPAAAATTLKLATVVPEGSLWDKELKGMAAEVQRRTQGRVVVRLYAGGIAGDDPDVVRKMRIGQLQAGTLTATGLGELEDGFAVFSVPRFLTSYPELFHVTRALEPMLTSRLDKAGFVFLGWGHAGFAHLFTKQAVQSPADLQRLKMFVWAGDDRGTQWWKSHGYHPVPLASTDIMTGLTTGMIEALPTPPLVALSLQWYRSAPFMLDIGLAPLVGATVVSKKAWAGISAEDQAVIRQIARAMEQRLQQSVPAQERKAIEEMSRRGLKVTGPRGPEQLKAWETVAAQFAASVRQQREYAEVFEAALKARDQFRAKPR
jgi:TRAP-type transport system periplasmic protein